MRNRPSPTHDVATLTLAAGPVEDWLREGGAALRHLHDAVPGTPAETTAEALIAGEPDEKMRKKLRTAWRQAGST